MNARANPLRASLAVVYAVTIVAAALVVSGLPGRAERAAGRPVLPDLYYLTEDMPVAQSTVPALAGTQWGTIVAVPQGEPAPVEPPECSLFLSQGEVSQKALAMRSSNGAAIGVELAVTPHPVDVDGLAQKCASFYLTTPTLRSSVRLRPAGLGPIPPRTISVLMRTTTQTQTQSLTWDIAMIVGTHRGLLVTAEYTPGPHGGVYEPDLAAKLPALYRAQLGRLDKK